MIDEESALMLQMSDEKARGIRGAARIISYNTCGTFESWRLYLKQARAEWEITEISEIQDE
jgi:hypothetical protein